MLRYSDFLLESLLLESVVYYSDKFKRMLSQIDSPVAKTLLDMESKDLEVVNNYLDVVDREQISFIPDRRAGQLIQSVKDKVTFIGGGGFLSHSEKNRAIFDLLEYEPVGEKTYHPNDGDDGVVLKTAESPASGNKYSKVQFEGGISAINNEKLRPVDVNKMLFSQNRQPIRIGRGIRAMLKPSGVEFTDSQIEDFVNRFKSAWDKMNDVFRNFEVVKEDKIAYWYDRRNYQSCTSNLGSSCMSGVDPEYFDIYVKNPDKISLVILKNDDGDKILGRALLWELDTPKITFMDRIYTSNDSYIPLFKDYCYKNGWYHKQAQNSSNHHIESKDDKKTEHLFCTLRNSRVGDYEKYPYLDTLKYFRPDTGQITSDYEFKRNNTGLVYTLEVTDGSWVENDECETCGGSQEVECYECEGSGNVDCRECRVRIGRTLSSTGTIECDECSGDGEIDCDECSGTGVINQGQEDEHNCENCSATGKVSCQDCDGDGKKDCPECDGHREVECDECGGRGQVSCPDC